MLIAFVWPLQLRMDVDGGEGGGTASARRRRERRLRMHWRHEQLSLRMALAAATHHSAQPRARKGEGPREARRPTGTEATFSGRADSTVVGGAAAGELAAARRHQVRDRPESRCSWATAGGPVAGILLFFAALSPVPKQLIEVPKILPDDVPLRTTVRDTQLVEQLVEVLTIISFSSLQRTVEQNVDIPVPHRAGRIAGLQGFPPEQSSTALLFF